MATPSARTFEATASTITEAARCRAPPITSHVSSCTAIKAHRQSGPSRRESEPAHFLSHRCQSSQSRGHSDQAHSPRLVKLAIRSDVPGPLERLESRLRFGSPFAVDPAGLESHVVESLLDLADLPCAQPIRRNPLSIGQVLRRCRNGRLGLRLKGLGYWLAVQS
jgi:hypothetical protein